jgi:Zn-dependent protease
MILTFRELIDFTILIIAIAYIFTSNFTAKISFKRFDFDNFKIALIATSPAVFFHELFHKITALALGYSATFHIFTPGIFIGVILKLISSPLLFIAPGFVSIQNVTQDIPYRLIAFAGPFANLLLFLIAIIILKKAKNLSEKQLIVLHLTKKINLILLIFNMIPFGPLDGAKVLFGLP